MIEQAVVSLTPEAQSRLKDLLAKEDNPGLALRIFVSGGGCSGMQYGMAFDDQRRQDDFVIDNEGVQIVVDDFSVNYIRGAEIDFDGTKPDEAAVKGEILVLTDPKSAISRGVEQLAQMIGGSTAGEQKEKKGFKLGRR